MFKHLYHQIISTLFVTFVLINPLVLGADHNPKANIDANESESQIEIKIGVLSHRGDQFTLDTWNPTASYLGSQLPSHHFKIIPLDFDEVDKATNKAEVDFILVNPSIYVNLEYKFRVSRLATMLNLRSKNAYKVFGGVIFTRSTRTDIKILADLKGKSFMAVDKTSLGGYQMAWRELNAIGITPDKDFSQLRFAGIHDKVVQSVINGSIDAGTVRTDILERMTSTKALDPSKIRIINAQNTPSFPFRLSTRLYPEWPFSKLRHTSDKLAKEVALALFKMPDNHPASIAGHYAGWDIPLDYQDIHDLFQELNLPPYDKIGKYTLKDAILKYWYWALLALFTLLLMTFIISAEVKRNIGLKRQKRNMERDYKLLLDSVGDGIYGVDINGNCTFVNSAMMKITGWKEHDLIGQNQHKILHHSHDDGTPYLSSHCPVYRTSHDNIARYIDDDIFWKKDGNPISVEYSCTPIQREAGINVGTVVVFRDTTTRKETEAKQRDHQTQLAHVARLSTLGEMASGIAHELNQPLTVISNYSRACMRMLESQEPMTTQCSEVMEKIAAQAERAGGIIKHIRHFVQKEPPKLNTVKLTDMLDVVQELTQIELTQQNITLKFSLDSSAPSVLAQDTMIEQVIINLVRNAAEAMTDTPIDQRIIYVISQRQQSSKVRITVKDTGSGINDHLVEQLFDPFITTKEGGMGLGLSISQGFVEAHDDRIQVVNNPSGGASFYFHLAIANND